jgi:hypothetical protein
MSTSDRALLPSSVSTNTRKGSLAPVAAQTREACGFVVEWELADRVEPG